MYSPVLAGGNHEPPCSVLFEYTSCVSAFKHLNAAANEILLYYCFLNDRKLITLCAAKHAAKLIWSAN